MPTFSDGMYRSTNAQSVTKNFQTRGQRLNQELNKTGNAINSNRHSSSSVQAGNMGDLLSGYQVEKSVDRKKTNLKMSSLRVLDVDLNT